MNDTFLTNAHSDDSATDHEIREEIRGTFAGEPANEDGCEGDDVSEHSAELDEPSDGFRDDVEADADALASAGFGTDEDYGYYGGDE